MVRHIILICCCFGCCLTATAQQTLDIHTTTDGIVSFAFDEKPVITFGAEDVLKVTSTRLTIEFPYKDVSEITFTDGLTGVSDMVVRDGAEEVMFYDLSGKLVRRVAAKDGKAIADMSALRSGTYVVKDGKRAYKIIKR